MLKSKLRRIMAIGLTVLTCMAITPLCASAEWRESVVRTEWSSRTKKWYSEGDSWATGWRKIDNEWYYFDVDTGYIVTGWNYIGGNWYYFNELGEMEHSRFIGEYYLNSKGIWIESPPIEVQKYWYILHDSDWVYKLTNKIQKSVPAHGIFSDDGEREFIPCSIRSIILDLNNDGIEDMITISEYGFVRVLTYKDGEIGVEAPKDSTFPEYLGYDEINHEIFVYSDSYGNKILTGYKLNESNNLETTTFYVDCVNAKYGIAENNKGYYLSKEDYYNFEVPKKSSKQQFYNKLNEINNRLDNRGKNKMEKILSNYN